MANTMEATTTMKNPIVMNQSDSGRSDDGRRSDDGGRSVETVEATPFQIQLTHSTMADISMMADPTKTTKRISKLSKIQRRLFCEKNDDPFEDDLGVEKVMAEWSTPPMYKKKKAKVVHFHADSKSTSKRITLSPDPVVSNSSSSDDMANVMPYAAAPTSTPAAPSACHAVLPKWANGLIKPTAEQAETMIQFGE